MNLREIDRLVAEHVLGLSRVDIVETAFGSTRHFTWKDHKNSTLYDDSALPNYSSDISAAWEVVEAMKMYEPELSWSDETHSWWFVFHKLPHRIQSQESAQLAICLAALKARSIDVPEYEP